jgi:hypothetical protein
MTTITLLKSDAQFLAAAIGRDPNLGNLMQVWTEQIKGHCYLVATEGHWGALVKVDAPAGLACTAESLDVARKGGKATVSLDLLPIDPDSRPPCMSDLMPRRCEAITGKFDREALLAFCEPLATTPAQRRKYNDRQPVDVAFDASTGKVGVQVPFFGLCWSAAKMFEAVFCLDSFKSPVGFDPSYLAPALRAIPEEKVALYLPPNGNSQTPTIVEAWDTDYRRLAIVMAVRL